MEPIDLLKEKYQTLEERIRQFILVHSNIEYVQGSSECVEGGAFAWSDLSPESRDVQSELYHEYVALIKQAGKHLSTIAPTHMDTFEQSCSEVEAYLKQDNLVWRPSLQELFANVKKELDLQRGLISQPAYI